MSDSMLKHAFLLEKKLKNESSYKTDDYKISNNINKLASKIEKKLEEEEHSDNDEKSLKKEKSLKVIDKAKKKLEKAKKQAKKAKKQLKKKLASMETRFIKVAEGVTMKLKYLDDDGDLVKLRVPAKYVICPECKGVGEVIDDEALEDSNHAETGLEEEVSSHKLMDCPHCKGKGIHKVFDPERASEEEVEAHDKYQDQEDIDEDLEGDNDDSLLKEAGLFDNPFFGNFNQIASIGKALISNPLLDFNFFTGKPQLSKDILNADSIEDLMEKLNSLKDMTEESLKSGSEKMKREDSDEEDEGDEDRDNEQKEKMSDGAALLKILNNLSVKGLDALKSDNISDALKYVKPLAEIFSKSGGSATALEGMGLAELAPLLGELGGIEGVLGGAAGLLEGIGPLLALL